MISVIIPTFQSAKTIIQCLESVLSQHGPAIEIIVVDDESTDATLELLRPYQSRLMLFSIEHAGASAARNFGAQKARGQKLFFCDSDVVLSPDALERLSARLDEHPESSYSYCGFRFDERSMPAVPFSQYWLKRINFISTMSLVRTNDFVGFDEQISRCQDWDFWLTMLEQGKRGTPEFGELFYTLPRQGISSNPQNRRVAERLVRVKHHLPIPSRIQEHLWRIGFWLYRRFGWFTD